MFTMLRFYLQTFIRRYIYAYFYGLNERIYSFDLVISCREKEEADLGGVLISFPTKNTKSSLLQEFESCVGNKE